jgi:hypothetical protein
MSEIPVVDSTSDDGLLKTLVEQTAKARSELECAQRDLETAKGRMNLNLVIVHSLIDKRKGK